MRDLEIDQRLRDHAISLAAGVHHRVGDHAHQAEPSAAVDETDAAAGHLDAERPGDFGERRGIGVPMAWPRNRRREALSQRRHHCLEVRFRGARRNGR